MASFSFWFLLIALMMGSMASFSFSFSSELKLGTPITTISAAPALLPNPSLSPSPFTELSPDITPLLPSPGGELPAPSGSSIPTIPSNPSPPNPDQIASVGPDYAVSPTGAELVSVAFSLSFPGYLNLAVLVCLVMFW